MKAGWQDAPLTLRDLVVNNMRNSVFWMLPETVFLFFGGQKAKSFPQKGSALDPPDSQLYDAHV